MTIRWTPEATADLEHISQHITEDNPDAAVKTVRTIFSRIEELVTFPHRGRKGRIAARFSATFTAHAGKRMFQTIRDSKNLNGLPDPACFSGRQMHKICPVTTVFNAYALC